MKINYLKTKFLLLLVLSIFAVSCTSTGKDKKNVDKISNEAQEDAKNNFNELKFLFENRKYEEAYNLLNDMKKTLPYSRYTKHGKILEIHSYYQQQKFNTTIEKANKFISIHPTHNQLDYVLYLRATSSFNLNKSIYKNLSQISNIIKVNRSKVRQTFSYFSEIVQKYPKSYYLKDSIKKIKKLRHTLSEYELNDAYILFDLAKYDEVIKRCDYIISNYPRSTLIPKTLKLQAKSYRLNGQIEMAKSIEANLRRNHSE